ncbi:MAG TPA: kynureninase [Stackebrandtia sp.]|uniref:kynureninase n=1 Tax=Stackebrandtia sp. TaxID=2023065 RepID=UPI002D2C77B3|nr:kynureninase [Stackebrandtia sp.]HZE38549.1 kynureninase [Stackebrandtia sp.]
MSSEPNASSDPVALDASDPLAAFRDEFAVDDDGVIYLDGNSLGRPPRAAAAAVARVVEKEWRHRLIRGWDDWIDLPRSAGDRIAELVGASAGEVLVGDSTSVNLYKLAAAALDAAPEGRRVIITDDDNFPTDRYILAGLAERSGAELRMIHTDIDAGLDPAALEAALGDDTALVVLSHVAYRSGALADMRAVTGLAHAHGARILWDLCHSAGAVGVELNDSGADLAVGCTYKYLNGGPGAPAFCYVRSDLQTELRQPIWGWFSQRDQFDMGPDYSPVDGIGRFAVGTPPVVALALVDVAVEVTQRAGMEAIRAKSLRLGEYARALSEEWLRPLGFHLASPADAARRGGHLTLAHAEAWRIGQAMRDQGVIPDYRQPDRLRLGFAPLYNTYADVHDGLRIIKGIVEKRAFERYDTAHGRVT